MCDFVKDGVFALLVVKTADGETVIRPIGGGYGNGINDAIEEILEKYPDCKLKIYEENYSAWRRYFEPFGIGRERIL